MSRCFLSYGRGDDEPFVERLRERLTQEEVECWWDRRSMRSRDVRFLPEIQDAIRSGDLTDSRR